MEIQSVVEAISSACTKSSNKIKAENQTLELDKSNFFALQPSSQKIAFIDGGNAELLDSPGLSLQYVRIASVIYEGRVRIERNKQDSWILTESTGMDFIARDLSGVLPTLQVDENDPYLCSQASKTTIIDITNLFRKQAEFREIIRLLESDPPDIIVRDGDLFPKGPNDKELLNKIKNLATSRGVLVAGLCKTTNALTDSGRGAAETLAAIGGPGPWIYSNNNRISFVKLNESAKHVFRLDLLNANDEAAFAVASALFPLSDPVFPGYPYPLIDVDRIARVSNKEKEFQKTRLFTQARQNNLDLEPLAKASNAHQILDSI